MDNQGQKELGAKWKKAFQGFQWENWFMAQRERESCTVQGPVREALWCTDLPDRCAP